MRKLTLRISMMVDDERITLPGTYDAVRHAIDSAFGGNIITAGTIVNVNPEEDERRDGIASVCPYCEGKLLRSSLKTHGEIGAEWWCLTCHRWLDEDLLDTGLKP